MDTADYERVAQALRGGTPASEIQTGRPSPARIYDYWLGGRNNYEVDREVAETILAMAPSTRTCIRENRNFLLRSVQHLAEQGVRQFLDLGCGLPFPPNVHEVVQSVDPDARVVYVDSDPIVLTHAHALMESSDPGHIAVVYADVRDPEAILDHPDTRRVLDFDKRVGLLMVALLHFVPDHDDPAGIIGRLLDRFPAGSRLVISHGTADFNPAGALEATESYHSTSTYSPRSGKAIEAFFDGLTMVEPGLVPIAQWPDVSVPARGELLGMYAGMGVKPERTA
jgi:S-adenosyl methyltransferase